MAAAIAAPGRPSALRKSAEASPVTSTIEMTSDATIPTTLAKLRYVSSAWPDASRIDAVSPAGTPGVK